MMMYTVHVPYSRKVSREKTFANRWDTEISLIGGTKSAKFVKVFYLAIRYLFAFNVSCPKHCYSLLVTVTIGIHV